MFFVALLGCVHVIYRQTPYTDISVHYRLCFYSKWKEDRRDKKETMQYNLVATDIPRPTHNTYTYTQAERMPQGQIFKNNFSWNLNPHSFKF